MTVADKLDIEDGRAPRTPRCGGRCRWRMRRAHDPARLRGRGRRCCRNAQEKRGDARGLRRQSQLAARHEIELPRLAPDLQHHGAERIAGQRVGGTAQRALAIGRAHHHQAARIEAELGQSAHRQRARFDFRKILPHPDQRPARGDAPGKACDKAGRGCALMSLGEHLMHRGLRKAAAQHRIRLDMAERHAPEPMHIAMGLEAFDVAAQSRERVHACAAHAPLPSDGGCRVGLNKNQPLAHLFMICSNIKLTVPAESNELRRR
jgi:hypothetical protein